MTKFSAFIVIIAIRIFYHPANNEQLTIAPFTSPSPLSTATIAGSMPAKLISVKGSISENKIFLNWEVGSNETADQFEIEKSTDGKHFTMAALVFGTDKPDNDKYEYYEKAVKQKMLYRIKLINKNKVSEYSAIITINPGTNS